jgi:hypothetical protein
MKMIVIVIAALCITAAARADTILPKLMIDLGGTHVADALGTSASNDTDPGIAFAGEYLTRISPIVKVGGGLEIQLPRKVKDISAGKFNFMPLYATAYVFPFKKMTKVSPYGRASLGYNLLFSGDNAYADSASTTSGLYWAIGAGARFLGVMADLSYSYYAGSAAFSNVFTGNYTTDITYTKVSISLGYAFSIFEGIQGKTKR